MLDAVKLDNKDSTFFPVNRSGAKEQKIKRRQNAKRKSNAERRAGEVNVVELLERLTSMVSELRRKHEKSDEKMHDVEQKLQSIAGDVEEINLKTSGKDIELWLRTIFDDVIEDTSQAEYERLCESFTSGSTKLFR